MEIYERVRYLRKNVLGMSQTEFGERLGVNRSVIKNIELNVLARPDQKRSLLKLIAREFNVREEWLLTGEDPMEASASEDELDMILRKYGLPHELKGLFLRVSRLPEESQELIQDWLRDWILETADEIRQKPHEAPVVPTMATTDATVEEEPENPPAGEQYTEEEIEERVEAYRALLKREQRMRRQYATERLLLGVDLDGSTNPSETGAKATSENAG